MAKLIKVFQSSLPELVLLGKCYHGDERDEQGTFSHKWGEWFANGWFQALEGCGAAHTDTGYVGAMRMKDGAFEYWIGMLMDSVSSVPDGFDTAEVRSCKTAAAWIKGRDDAELYSKHEECMAAFAAKGLTPAADAWYIESYSCPRFTVPDENGEVILDYLVTLD